MNVTIEISYLERRIRDTLHMARTCRSSCGKVAHLALADLYALKVKELQANLSLAPSSQPYAPTPACVLRQIITDRAIVKCLPLTIADIALSARKNGALSIKVPDRTKPCKDGYGVDTSAPDQHRRARACSSSR